MADLLECKYCGQKIRWNKCVKHLKFEQSLYSTNPYSFFNEVVLDQLKIKEKNLHNNIKNKNQIKERKKTISGCFFCGIIFHSKEHKETHLYKVHGKTKYKKLSQNPEIYKPAKPQNKPFPCGEFLGLTSNYVRIYYSGFETNRRKH